MEGLKMKKLPIGMQSFPDIINRGFTYVDKTDYVYEMAQNGKPYFLARPRRFGKSLLVSTIKAYFEGRQELFLGLKIADLEKEWTQYPVFQLDLNGEKYDTAEALEKHLDRCLRIIEGVWGKGNPEDTLSGRFADLIQRVYEKTGNQVVVLIDEYDKPLLEAIDNPSLSLDYKNTLRAFYGVLKSADPYLRFVLLTGVTKFSQVSIFSDLNQLNDISMDRNYAGICGMTVDELETTFGEHLEKLGDLIHYTHEELMAELKQRYDGYHFSEYSEGMFNPFSVLNTLDSGKFKDYWFQTGTPTFLVKKLKQSRFDLLQFKEGIKKRTNEMMDYRVDSPDPVPVLYQSGYLTIKSYENRTERYVLGFPNAEVEYGFLNALMPYYTVEPADPYGFFVDNFRDDLMAGDVDGFMNRMTAFFAAIPYDLENKVEKHYQTVFYLLFTLMGQYVKAEVKSAVGRADAVVETDDAVYVFEFKLEDGTAQTTAEAALAQIDEKSYLIPYTAMDKKLVKVGVVFDHETRTVGSYLIG
jgi:hypothetical protein